jgi:hypothetical protein
MELVFQEPVITGLDPVIHAAPPAPQIAWIRGSSPRMTIIRIGVDLPPHEYEHAISCSIIISSIVRMR